MAQGALEEAEVQLRRKDEELAAVQIAVSEGPSMSSAEGVNEPAELEAMKTTVLLTAIQDTAKFLEDMVSAFDAVDMEDEHSLSDLRLPKLISNTGNKSFQSILEHEEIKELYDQRFARAAAAITNDTKGSGHTVNL